MVVHGVVHQGAKPDSRKPELSGVPQFQKLPFETRVGLARLPPRNTYIDYERFNYSNVSVCLWSRNYRGCWHLTCPPLDTLALV